MKILAMFTLLAVISTGQAVMAGDVDQAVEAKKTLDATIDGAAGVPVPVGVVSPQSGAPANLPGTTQEKKSEYEVFTARVKTMLAKSRYELEAKQAFEAREQAENYKKTALIGAGLSATLGLASVIVLLAGGSFLAAGILGIVGGVLGLKAAGFGLAYYAANKKAKEKEAQRDAAAIDYIQSAAEQANIKVEKSVPAN